MFLQVGKVLQYLVKQLHVTLKQDKGPGFACRSNCGLAWSLKNLHLILNVMNFEIDFKQWIINSSIVNIYLIGQVLVLAIKPYCTCIAISVGYFLSVCVQNFSSLQYTQSLKAKDEWNSSFNFDLLNPEVILSTKNKKLDLWLEKSCE